VKHFVSNFADSYGAWRSDEEPNRRPFQVMFPYPTGDCTAEEIVSIAIKDNNLEGDLSSSSYSKKIPKIGHFIRFVADLQFTDGLERLDFRPFCGLTRLNVFDEKQLQRQLPRSETMGAAPNFCDHN